MPGSLVKITETTVSSAVRSSTITGMDSTYDVYKIIYETSNYDYAAKKLKTYSSFQTVAQTNQNLARLTDEKLGDQAQETANGILYIFNASNSSEYTFWTMENVNRDAGGNLMSMTGGGVLTVTSAVDGIFFFIDASNIVSGTFKLYGIKK